MAVYVQHWGVLEDHPRTSMLLSSTVKETGLLDRATGGSQYLSGKGSISGRKVTEEDDDFILARLGSHLAPRISPPRRRGRKQSPHFSSKKYTCRNEETDDVETGRGRLDENNEDTNETVLGEVSLTKRGQCEDNLGRKSQ